MAAPDDIARWRTDAKALRLAVRAGDATAFQRVLSSHPKYVDRPIERVRQNRAWFSLRDAQLTVAREQGRDNWEALSDQGRRWPHRMFGSQQGRAARIALERGDRHCGPEHLLLALAAPPRPTIASAVLSDVAADLVTLRDRPPLSQPSDRKQVTTNPACMQCVSCAVTFAVAEGSDQVTDEHVLLALAYTAHGSDLLNAVGVDPDEIYDALAARGVTVPPIRPPFVATVRGPYNPKLVVHRDDLNAVIKVLRTRHPPGSEHWGMNYSSDDPNEGYLITEDTIDIEAIAREALGPEGTFRFEPDPQTEGTDQ